jgi:hypothetical protein
MIHKDTELCITPLCAAFVEALPNRVKAHRINRRFKQQKKCPSSSLFTVAEVEKFYADRGVKVVGVEA